MNRSKNRPHDLRSNDLNSNSGDYDDFVYCDKEMIDEYTPKVVDFIRAIKLLLGNS